MKYFIQIVFLFFITLRIGASNPVTDSLIYDLNPAHFDMDFNQYDRNTAIYCAQLSEVAYWDCCEITKLIAGLNMEYPNSNHRYRFLEDEGTGTQLIFFGTSNYIVMSFRGTEFTKEFKDIVLDGKYFTYYQDSGYSNLPAGHGGFRRAIINLSDNNDIFNELRNFQKLCNVNHEANFPIYTTGHSLGAALATIIIEALEVEGFSFSGCYNFAPPLVIDKNSAEQLHEKYNPIVYDIVNYLDYVTRAGKKSRNNLGRIGKFYRICQSGIICNEDEKRNGKYISHPWRTKFRLYKYHKLSGYLEGVKNLNNTNEDIILRKENGVYCF